MNWSTLSSRSVFGSWRPVSCLETTSSLWWRSTCVDKPTGRGSRRETTRSSTRFHLFFSVDDTSLSVPAGCSAPALVDPRVIGCWLLADLLLQRSHAAVGFVWTEHQLQGWCSSWKCCGFLLQHKTWLFFISRCIIHIHWGQTALWGNSW